MVLRQLEKPEAREMYQNIVIDTLNEAWDLCTDYICAQASVQKIKEIPFGQGYKDRDAEFANTLRRILNLSYGLIVTTHTKEISIGDGDDTDLVKLAPDLDKRCVPIISGLVDLMGMIVKTWNTEKGDWERWLLTKATPTVSAGTRMKYLAPKIPFGYKYLEDAVTAAITEAQRNGATVIEQDSNNQFAEKLNYVELRAKAQTLWTKLTSNGTVEANEDMARRVLKKVEMIFGQPKKISEITEDQVDLLQLVVLDMEDLAAAL